MVSAGLEVTDLEVSYGDTQVLKRISLAVAGGEFVALLGPSGCGKTTLLRAISGFVPVASGRVAVAGREITHEPPDKRGMAMVFQSYALWPHMTTAQNLGYGLKLRRVAKPEIARRVADILAMLKLEGFGERNVTQLSGGQRQRVALGRALAVNPEVLLLDEPLSNLDARIREDVRHEIKALQAKLGITTIHVTHDREEAMVMADRIAILDAGRIAQLGAPEEVYNRPNSPCQHRKSTLPLWKTSSAAIRGGGGLPAFATHRAGSAKGSSRRQPQTWRPTPGAWQLSRASV